ncbi:MAG: acetoin dehydrogenase dihydrolipoyllysine-residue acetyltransferase subunit, partial [Burkholderiales bacterium]|nr:acetoin dehydrogenase dihydrolipoyllysine-residue acetyltransferase subunit [Burkholderiales bacterium]
MGAITPIVMPKWGLSMSEGTVVSWLVEEGTEITVGLPILEVETDKIANAVEAPDPGLLRRRVAQAGELLPVKALLGVMAPAQVSDADIDAYIAAYVVPAAGEGEDADAAPAYLYAEVDDFRVRYARRGDEHKGPPVLFLHGFGGDLDNWLFNLDAVAAAAPVVALDLPAHGQSTVRLPGAASLVDMAGFVLRFLDAIDVERVSVVGHSMGGAIAAQMALLAPQRVASLVLVASAGLGEEINTGYTEGFVAAASRRELKPVLEQLFADPSLVSRQMIDDMLKYKRLDGVGACLSQLGGALFVAGRQTSRPVAQVKGVPLTVIWGRQDRVIPARHAELAPAGASVLILEDAGHMVMMEKAAEVNAR